MKKITWSREPATWGGMGKEPGVRSWLFAEAALAKDFVPLCCKFSSLSSGSDDSICLPPGLL